MQAAQLKFVNAVNMLVSAQPGILQAVSDSFGGDFESAWQSSRLKKFLPKDAPAISSVKPEKEWEKIEREGLKLIAIFDSAYPEPLKNIADPPFLLYLKGEEKILKNPCLAVVGTRNITDYGRRTVPFILERVIAAGFTIVSGLAVGVDGLAHREAVKYPAPTIAVLGGGVNVQSIRYENRPLAKEILNSGGAIISEYDLSLHGSKMSFPQRNRIISGLSKGVLIVEADQKSGSLITAHCALDQNRDLFAVPGSIFSARSEGTNNLLKMGAKAVTSAEDILTEYQLSCNLLKPAIIPHNNLEAKILAIISREPASLDTIINGLDIPTGEVISCLMNMELENRIINLGNNRFALPA